MFNRNNIEFCCDMFAVASDRVIPFVVWAYRLSGRRIFRADFLLGPVALPLHCKNSITVRGEHDYILGCWFGAPAVAACLQDAYVVYVL